MRRLWLAGCQVRACLSAPWSLGKVNVPLNQTSGKPSPLSAGRCCSLPAEFKVHSHLLPQTYPEPQNGGGYALIKLSWGGFDSRLWWGLVMKRLYALKMSPSQLHGIMHVSDARGGFLFIDFHKVYFIYRVSLHIKDDFNTMKAWSTWDLGDAVFSAHPFILEPWEEISMMGTISLRMKKHLVAFLSPPGIKRCSIKELLLFFKICF